MTAIELRLIVDIGDVNTPQPAARTAPQRLGDARALQSRRSASYTDTGLASGTGYHYTVAAVDSAGSVGASSSPVLATTNGYIPACFTDNNYNQVAAGRAHQSGGYAYANGSNQNMGLYNLYLTHTLEETSDGHYVIADSGCPA
ncbi:hypothetical protein [Streptomyces kaempferi]|uniref:Fibronectin type-III domain-containing protein n=1 Tax=Streptomyces kaempferi TaxID=333725 RepID=A0ABW3XL10_9ACTN